MESVLNRFPGVHLSAVVGEPEADGNERVVAFLELWPGAALDHEALRVHLAQHLSPYKRPARIEVISSLPITANGKVVKRALPLRP